MEEHNEHEFDVNIDTEAASKFFKSAAKTWGQGVQEIQNNINNPETWDMNGYKGFNDEEMEEKGSSKSR